MANRNFWGEAPQQEYTKSRLCPGPLGSSVLPHSSRWWRMVDLKRRDGFWHCCVCGWECPEVSPIDGSASAVPAVGRARTLTF